jgi:hypothetical protein
MVSNMRFYTLLGIGSLTRLNSNLYVRITPQGSSSQVPKDSPSRVSLTNDYKVYTMVFTIISTFYFFKYSYSHMILLQVLTQLTTWSYWMQIMSQKPQSLPLIYLKERSEWIVNHIHLHLILMYQTNHQVPLIIFHFSTNRFNIIWSLGFGQVRILGLAILQTWNGLSK